MPPTFVVRVGDRLLPPSFFARLPLDVRGSHVVLALSSLPCLIILLQLAEFIRAGGVTQPQHTQQPRLQGFPPQMHQHQNPNPNPNASPNPNSIHYGLNPNATAPLFNSIGGLTNTQMTASQLQALAERNPSLRAALQQHQQRQQQQPQAGGTGSPFDPVNLGLTMSVPSPNQAPHPITPVNASATASANAAELSRQYHLMSRAGQNQGQNGNTLNAMNQGAPIMNRPQQPVQSTTQQNPSFQQQQIPNGGNMQMGPHLGQQPHPNPNQQHLNRQMFPSMPSQFPAGATPNMTNTLVGSGGHPQQPQQPSNQQPPQQMQPARRPLDRQKIDQHLVILQAQIQNIENQLRSTGFNAATPMTATESHRSLFTELQAKKTQYVKISTLRQQMDKMPAQGVSGPSGGADGSMNLMQNG